ncbi:hypothetical protein WN943_027503 [Citrus x changshan-huyou]
MLWVCVLKSPTFVEETISSGFKCFANMGKVNDQNHSKISLSPTINCKIILPSSSSSPSRPPPPPPHRIHRQKHPGSRPNSGGNEHR